MGMYQVNDQFISISKAITNTLKMIAEDEQAKLCVEQLKKAEENYQQALVFNLSQPIKRSCI